MIASIETGEESSSSKEVLYNLLEFNQVVVPQIYRHDLLPLENANSSKTKDRPFATILIGRGVPVT